MIGKHKKYKKIQTFSSRWRLLKYVNTQRLFPFRTTYRVTWQSNSSSDRSCINLEKLKSFETKNQFETQVRSSKLNYETKFQFETQVWTSKFDYKTKFWFETQVRSSKFENFRTHKFFSFIIFNNLSIDPTILF